MSYMDPPRIHFSGSFWTDPSTINNATENYSLTIPYNNQPPSATNPNSVWWNQYGKAYFKIPSATVTAAMNPQYQLLTTSSQDAVIGAQIVSVPTGAGNPQYGRLVDLDPDQQARSMIVGLKVQITLGEPGVSLSGVIRPMNIIDLWGRVMGGSGSGIESAGAMFQSVIEELEWQGISTTSSSILQQLYKASPQQLSFKMVLDGYNGQTTSPQFANGRMVGTIGPQYAGEPAHFLAKRRMFTGGVGVPVDSNGNPDTVLNNAPIQLSGTQLTVDLGNSVPTSATHGGPFKDVGTVAVVIDPKGSNITISPPLFTSAQGYAQQYTLTAGIFQVDLGSTNAALAANKPLALSVTPPTKMTAPMKGLQAARLKTGQSVAAVAASQPANSVPAGTAIGLAERANGLYADVSLNVARIEKGAPAWSPAAESSTEITGDAQIVITATQFGVPAPNLAINVTLAGNVYQFQNDQGQFYPINNDPLSTIGWTAGQSMKLTTDAKGQAVARFVAGDLTNSQKAPRRQILDGQLYLFTHDYSMDPSGQPITLLVFENSPVASNPTWYQDVQPVLLQYARLYPFMRSLIDLGSYQALTNTALGIPQKLQSAMTLPMTHPAFMPVTRDLSLRNRQMILTWIANGMPEGTPPSTPKPVS